MRSAQSICLLAARSARAGLLVCSEPAQAALTYHIDENSGNVIIETQRSLNLPAPSSVDYLNCGTSLGGVLGLPGVICTGPATITPIYSITGPTSFTEPGNFQFGTSSSGKSTILFAGYGLFTIKLIPISLESQSSPVRPSIPKLSPAWVSQAWAPSTPGPFLELATRSKSTLAIPSRAPCPSSGPLPPLGSAVVCAAALRTANPALGADSFNGECQPPCPASAGLFWAREGEAIG